MQKSAQNGKISVGAAICRPQDAETRRAAAPVILRRRLFSALVASILTVAFALSLAGCVASPNGAGLPGASPPGASGAQGSDAPDADGAQGGGAHQADGAQDGGALGADGVQGGGLPGSDKKQGGDASKADGTQGSDASGGDKGQGGDTPGKPAPPATQEPADGYGDGAAGGPGSSQHSSFARFIPLFEYGVGTWNARLSAYPLPLFLSEEDAFAVISEVFAEVGMTLGHGGDMLENINLPVTNIFGEGLINGRYATVLGNLEPDGTLEELWLPVVYVSAQDMENWHEDGGASPPGLDAFVYYFKKAAQALAENNPGLAVFYDPYADLDYDSLEQVTRNKGESDADYSARLSAIREEEAQAALDESKSLLRLQAEAFIAWLEYGDEG